MYNGDEIYKKQSNKLSNRYNKQRKKLGLLKYM